MMRKFRKKCEVTTLIEYLLISLRGVTGRFIWKVRIFIIFVMVTKSLS
jgi:hypothetical protein